MTNALHAEPSHLYEYAVIRYMPDVERGEFVNIGLMLMCKRKRLLLIRWQFPPQEWVIKPHAEVLKQQLENLERIARGNKDGGPVALLEPEERFRWLTAVRSTCLQTSRPHPGLTNNLQAEFDRLYNRLVRRKSEVLP